MSDAGTHLEDESVDWQAYRDSFPVTNRAIYLNTGWSGPSSRAVVEAIRRRIEREAYDGPASLDVRHEKALLVQASRAALATLIGASEGQVALLNTTTEGVNIGLRGLDLGAGDELVTCNLEHSSVMVPCYELRRQTGVEVTVVRSSSRETADDLARLFEEAITHRTKLIVVSHISYNRGTRVPLERIVAAAHAVGALVLVDGAQSAGQIAIDVNALDVDIYAFPVHKYVLGPDGVAGFYVRPDLIERLRSTAVAHGASEFYDFSGTFTPRLATMRKFEMATHSGPLLAGAVEALGLLQSTGIAAIEARILALAGRLLAGLERIRGVTINGPLDDALRSGLVVFTIDDQDPNETCAALERMARVVGRVVNDRRVRLSVAAFNDDSDVDTALEVIEQLATQGLPKGAMSAADYKAALAEDDD